MRIRWLSQGLRSLEDQIAYISERNPHAAIEIAESIEAAVSMLEDYPKLARDGRVSGTRELVVAGTPHIVAYRLKDETIQILRVLHSAQDWPSRKR